MEASGQIKGAIFDIQGFSVHDGPGCRTVVFFKGCTMQCRWCSNPEGIGQNGTLLYNREKCIFDKNCITSCAKNALSIREDNLFIDREICKDCTEKACTANCYTEALRVAGKTYTVEELFQRIQRDRSFWGADGGITLSGGEPFMQPEFATALLKKCYDSYIHTAIETCGNVPWSSYEKALEYIEWVFFDLKHLDPTIHKQATQVSNEVILSNAVNFTKHPKARIVFRMVLIPGLNDTDENLRKTAEFMKSLGKNEINILPLHHLGRGKYDLLDTPYTALEYPIPSPAQLKNAKETFSNYGIACYLGSETPF